MKTITKKEREIAAAYEKADAKPFGTLHERMKYALEQLKKLQNLLPERECSEISIRIHDLGVSLHDLAGEVQFHEPVAPPFAQRRPS